MIRLLEDSHVAGAIIVAAYHTDLGDKNERDSGYFDRPWPWETMRTHAPWYQPSQRDERVLAPFRNYCSLGRLMLFLSLLFPRTTSQDPSIPESRRPRVFYFL